MSRRVVVTRAPSVVARLVTRFRPEFVVGDDLPGSTFIVTSLRQCRREFS